MKELALGATTFAIAIVAMQSVAFGQTVTPTVTTTPTTTITTTVTPSPTGQVQGAAVTVPAGAPATGFGGK